MQELNEAEMFRSVLNEMLQELKQLHNGVKEMNKAIAGQNEKIEGFRSYLENLKVEAAPPDLQPLTDRQAAAFSTFNGQVKESLDGVVKLFTQYLQKLSDAVEAQPKPIVRRICFFPENDHNGHFKYFIKVVILGGLGVCALAVILSLGRQYIAQRNVEAPVYHSSGFSFGEGPRPAAPASSGVSRRGKTSRRRHAEDSSGVVGMGRRDSSIVLGGGGDSGR